LLETALESVAALARPEAVVAGLSIGDFQAVYGADGHNDPETPVADIAPKAERLALFAATLGEELSAEIQGLFDGGDLAGAVMLDAAASAAAERMVELLEVRFSRVAGASPNTAVLAYSPGYCGWHVSGQRALFAALRPAEAGITLNDSCLMRPLKSVSGVLVAGPPSIHEFDDDYPCCSACTTRECRDRIARIRSFR
jgi:hypothetical protein